MNILQPPELEPYYNDERLQLEKYRAGYYAFTTMAALAMLVMTAVLFWWEREISVGEAGGVVFIIAFIGTMVFVVQSWRAGMFTALREQINSRAATRRKLLRRLVIATLLLGITGFLSDYYLMSSIDETPRSIGRSLLLSIPEMIFWGLAMYGLQMRKLKKSEEE